MLTRCNCAIGTNFEALLLLDQQLDLVALAETAMEQHSTAHEKDA
jgi:hypothetical protein